MSSTTSAEVDTAEAKRIWRQYREQHDVSGRKGQTAGIDPVSGRIWFGESGLDTVRRMRAEGIDHPLFFVRVGYDYYPRKGGHR